MDIQSELKTELQKNGAYLSSLLTSIQLKVTHPDLPTDLSHRDTEDLKRFLEQQQKFNSKLLGILNK